MSRSRPTNINQPNPAAMRFKWSGGQKSKGALRYYSKTRKEELDVKPPFRFILLDELYAITGFHKKSNSSIYSNQIRSTKEEPLTVKSKSGVLAEGLYADIKERVKGKSIGGKFTSNLYIAFAKGSEWVIGMIQFSGSGLQGWMEFKKDNPAVFDKAVKIVGSKQDTNGDVDFYVPVFEVSDTSVNENDIAVSLDTVLQEYFDGYFRRSQTGAAAAPAPSNHRPSRDEEDELEPPPDDSPVEDDEFGPDDDDIPF